MKEAKAGITKYAKSIPTKEWERFGVVVGSKRFWRKPSRQKTAFTSLRCAPFPVLKAMLIAWPASNGTDRTRYLTHAAFSNHMADNQM